MEIAIRQTFEAAAVSTLSPGSQIDIFIQLLQSDGGELCAAINATTLALCDAGIPLSQLVCSCSAGLLSNTVVLDLNYAEQKADPVILPVAMMPNTEKVTMVRMDAKLELKQLEGVMQAALQGCKIIHGLMSEHIKAHTLKQLNHSGLI